MSRPLIRAMRAPTPLDPERAWDYALLLLGRRSCTAAEMRVRLERRSLPEADADRVVARLQELDLLNDRAFARAYVRSRTAGRGRLGLARELRRKGVAEDVVDDALADATDEAQGRAAAELIRKQAWRFRDAALDDPERAAAARARAFALLARRGFPSDAARHAVEQVLGEIDAA
ncbi:hypothetical protein BH23DEI1_BH23DEI1_05040 [soil metagenome]